MSLEWQEDEPYEPLRAGVVTNAEVVMGEMGFRPTTEIKTACEEAGVSYSIHLHEKMRCKQIVNGGLTLDEDWDEQEIVYPRN